MRIDEGCRGYVHMDTDGSCLICKQVDPMSLSPKQLAEAIHAYAPRETSPMLEKLALDNLIDGRTLVNCSEDLLSR